MQQPGRRRPTFRAATGERTMWDSASRRGFCWSFSKPSSIPERCTKSFGGRPAPSFRQERLSKSSQCRCVFTFPTKIRTSQADREHYFRAFTIHSRVLQQYLRWIWTRSRKSICNTLCLVNGANVLWTAQNGAPNTIEARQLSSVVSRCTYLGILLGKASLYSLAYFLDAAASQKLRKALVLRIYFRQTSAFGGYNQTMPK